MPSLLPTRKPVLICRTARKAPKYLFSPDPSIVSASSSFSLKKIAVAAYGPSLLFGMVEGAIYPVIALSARNLGASIAEAGLIVALTGVGALLNNIPASLLTARFGERLSMTGAALLAIVALLLCVSAANPVVFGIGIFMIGMAQSVFLLARQTYLTDAVPISMRARALSTLGGVMRIGLFISPFISALLMQIMGLDGAYWLAAIAAAAAGALAFTLPDLESRKKAPGRSGTQLNDPRKTADSTEKDTVRQQTDESTKGPASANPSTMAGRKSISTVLREHRRAYLTLGSSCLLVSALRASRQVVIPLWAAHIMLDAATTSVIYGAMGAIDMLLFYPAGKIMDRYGRQWVALPSMAIMGIALLLMPLTGNFWTFLLATMLLGLGNGIGSGLVMTVGADCSPANARPQFLGLWRFMTDIGTCGGPLLVSGIAAAAGLASGILAVSSAGFIAAAMFWKWLPRQ